MLGQATLCDFCATEFPTVARDKCAVCARDCCGDHAEERLLMFARHNGPFQVPFNAASMGGHVQNPIMLSVSLMVCNACCNGTPSRVPVVSTLGAAARDGLLSAWRAALAELALTNE